MADVFVLTASSTPQDGGSFWIVAIFTDEGAASARMAAAEQWWRDNGYLRKRGRDGYETWEMSGYEVGMNPHDPTGNPDYVGVEYEIEPFPLI